MKFSLNWIRDFVDLKNISEKELMNRLTLSTCEVEDVIHLDEYIRHTVIGEIAALKKHPNAQRLQIAETRINMKTVIPIVCGGTNLREGAKVVVALPGAMVKWHGEEQWTELKETDIRGVRSHGMICAAEELGIPWRHTDEEGEHPIMILPEDAPNNTSIVSYLGLGDIILDIDNKSITHRADLFSHAGMATELGAIFRRTVRDPRYPHPKSILRSWDSLKRKKGIRVTIQAHKAVPRYTALLLTNVTITTSPLWIQNRLRAIGIRPINNVVDATNYAMFEIGVPLHAFDASKIQKGTKHIRYAKDGEVVKTLDGKDHALTSKIILAADGRGRIIDLPGIMGGALSEIDPSTTQVWLQSAVFDRVLIRKSCAALNHRTDASALFERGIDPELTPGALLRALELIRESSPSLQTVQLFDTYNTKPKSKTIAFSSDYVTRQLGIRVTTKDVERTLTSLGFPFSLRQRKNQESEILVSVPSRRKDIFGSQDLGEEIGRIFGYDHIAPAPLYAPLAAPNPLPAFSTRQSLRSLFTQLRFQELYQYLFLSSRDPDIFGLDPSSLVAVQNPISQELQYLRTSIIPTLFYAILKNQERSTYMRFFEIGKVFPAPFSEEEFAALALSSSSSLQHLFREMYGIFEEIAKALKLSLPITSVQLSEVSRPDMTFYSTFLHSSHSALLHTRGTPVGVIGLAHERVLETLGINTRIAFLELNLRILAQHSETRWEYTRIQTFPSTFRDLAFVIQKTIPYRDMHALITRNRKLLKDCSLFDMYQGELASLQKHSLAFHLEFASPERTLTSEEVEQELQNIINDLQKAFQIEMR